MAGYSTYPTAFDATFPGYPYVNSTEYVDQTHANAWVSAIQNLETTIGYGGIGNPASPLYSAAYNTTYATLTARIVATEQKVLNGLTINSSNGVIQSVGASNQAGASGLAADAAHVHASTASPSSYVPIGGVILWPGPISTIPGGGTYFQCNGQLVSTTTYGLLYTALGSGSVYGTSGGSFYLPNFNDRFPIGVNSTAPAVGATGGSTSISVNNMPQHAHNITDPGHNTPSYLNAGLSWQGVVTMPTFNGNVYAIPKTDQAGIGPLLVEQINDNWHVASTGISVQNTGSGTPYTQPFLGVYFLIRAL